MASIRTVEETFRACTKINQIRARYPYKPEELKKKFPEVAKELLIVLAKGVLPNIDEIIRDKQKIITEIDKIPPSKRKKLLMEQLNFLTSTLNIELYVNLHNNLI